MGKILKKGWLAAAATLMAASAFAQFQPTVPLPRALLSHTAVTLEGRIYVAGGISDASGSSYLNNVYYCAQILTDGQLGPWLAASPMPEFLGLGMHAAASLNGRLYVLGGTNLYGPRNVSYYSGVNPDGTLTGWTRTSYLPDRLYAHAAAVYGDRIYISGGLTSMYGPTPKAYSAQVNAAGGLGSWRVERAMPGPLFGHKSFAREGKLYVLGGSSAPGLYGPGGVPSGALSGAVYAAAINPDGTLGAWEAQPSLPSDLAFYGLAISENSAYLVGGFDGGTSNAVYVSPFNEDGSLGTWQALQALPRGLLSLAAVSNGEYMYSLGGGLSYIDDPVPDIYFSKLKSELQAFVKMTPSAINAKANGKWVSVSIGLPEADAGAVDPASVRISGLNGESVEPIEPDPKSAAKVQTGDDADFSDMAGVKYLKLKFSRERVAQIIKDGEFTISLEGRLADGRQFKGRSMNKGLHSEKLVTTVTEIRDGEREGPGGVKVNIPKGAFKGNPELLLRAAPEEDDAVAPEVKAKRSKGMKSRGLTAASEAFEFGPHGMAFEKPVKISLPYAPENLPEGADEEALKVAYWNDGTGEWEMLASLVSKADKMVSADVSHFSTYQIMSEAVPSAAPAPASGFSLGEVYVFPNPARPGDTQKLHISVASGDKASVRVYSSSGRLAFETAVSGAPGMVDGAPAYELDLRGGLPSGVYYYSAEVRSGSGKLKKAGKFAVVR